MTEQTKQVSTRLDINDLKERLRSHNQGEWYQVAQEAVDALESLYRAEDARERAATIALLREMPHWLTAEEATRLTDHLYAGGTIEFEAGVCRQCRGDGELVVGSRCFGVDRGECQNCHRHGMVEKRVKVPGADGVVCTCRTEALGLRSMQSLHDNVSADEWAALSHLTECPKRTA